MSKLFPDPAFILDKEKVSDFLNDKIHTSANALARAKKLGWQGDMSFTKDKNKINELFIRK